MTDRDRLRDVYDLMERLADKHDVEEAALVKRGEQTAEVRLAFDVGGTGRRRAVFTEPHEVNGDTIKEGVEAPIRRIDDGQAYVQLPPPPAPVGEAMVGDVVVPVPLEKLEVDDG